MENWPENRLLRVAFGSMAPACVNDAELVALKKMGRLRDSGDEWIYFPFDALVAVQLGGRGHAFQVGLVDNRGGIGLHSLFAGDFPSLETLVLRAGKALRIRRAALVADLIDNAGVQGVLARYVVGTAGDFLAEAAAATTLTLERRVARWIANSCRILERADIRFTHQEIASALGVRRSGVTVALHILEGEGLIRSRRMRVSLLDRIRLERFAELDHGQEPSSARRQADRPHARPDHIAPPGDIALPQPI